MASQQKGYHRDSQEGQSSSASIVKMPKNVKPI